MKRGTRSFKNIQKFYHEIDKIDNYVLFEDNLNGDEYAFILVDIIRNCYTYTWESISYTLDNPYEFTWFRFLPIS